MKELDTFIESVHEDCSDTPLVEAVEKATRCIFAEAEEAEDTTTETITDEPTAEETAPAGDDELNLDATPAPDADTVNSEPDNGTAPEPQAEGGKTTEPATPEVTGTETETAETVNQTPAPGMDPKELVTKFVMSGAVRKAQDDMVQTGNTSLVDFEKNIAAALAKFCVDNQIPTLSEADGVKIAKALAIRYGRAK